MTNLQRVMEQTEYADQFPESEFLLALGKLEERLNVQYAPSQKEAIQTALTSPMMILTGGPGTGKTTVIKGIVELYAELHVYMVVRLILKHTNKMSLFLFY